MKWENPPRVDWSGWFIAMTWGTLRAVRMQFTEPDSPGDPAPSAAAAAPLTPAAP